MARITVAQIDAMLADADAEQAEISADISTLREENRPMAERIARREARLARITDVITSLRLLKDALGIAP